MSINYCTIDSMPIDGFCGTQRAKVLARLLAQKNPVVPTPQPSHGYGGSISTGVPGFSPWGNVPDTRPPIYRPYNDPRDLDIKDAPPFEQPYITVTVELLGATGTETQESSARLDFVTISDLEVNAQSVVTVNISEMEIKHARNR